MDKAYRWLAILQFVKSSNKPVSITGIIDYLIEKELLSNSLDAESSNRRKVQRDMRDLLSESTDDHFDEEKVLPYKLGLVAEEEGRRLLYRFDRSALADSDFSKVSPYTAFALSMADKHLSSVLPEKTMREMQPIFDMAKANLVSRSIGSLSANRMDLLLSRIEYTQRGLGLIDAKVDSEILDPILEAIARGRRIKFHYNGKARDCHPYGVVVKEPKVYLLGVESSEGDEKNPVIKTFMVHRIEELVINKNSSKVPSDFNLKEYMDQGGTELFINGDRNKYKLKLRLANPGGNLLDDLHETPLNKEQVISEASTENEYLLSASVYRTVALINWIMMLDGEIEVLEPRVIREDVVKRIERMRESYSLN